MEKEFLDKLDKKLDSVVEFIDNFKKQQSLNIKPSTIMVTDRVDTFIFQSVGVSSSDTSLLFTVPLKKTLVDISIHPYIIPVIASPSMIVVKDINWTIQIANRDLEWIKITPLMEKKQTVPLLEIMKESQQIYSVITTPALAFYFFLRITGTLMDNNDSRLYQYEGVSPYGVTRVV